MPQAYSSTAHSPLAHAPPRCNHVEVKLNCLKSREALDRCGSRRGHEPPAYDDGCNYVWEDHRCRSANGAFRGQSAVSTVVHVTHVAVCKTTLWETCPSPPAIMLIPNMRPDLDCYRSISIGRAQQRPSISLLQKLHLGPIITSLSETIPRRRIIAPMAHEISAV